jgi:acetyl-CoA carboxylase biotin carboxylase subunit
MKKITKVLIANRGEIAVRIIRTLHKMGIQSVAVFADNDAEALHVRVADESIGLGNGKLSDTYLNVEKIIRAALQSGAQAIHPGYGFLSENPILTEACKKNELLFIGPPQESITLMGNKITARQYAVEAGLPITKGITGSPEELLRKAGELPFPVLVKAASGGGGKGMRIVRNKEELPQILETTAREAQNYFGDGTVYIEQFIENPRHIEIQVLADQHGNAIHLYERECSIQRRYQKIIEESPSPTLTPEVREKMGKAAVAICQKIGYQSAGTIEFLVDPELNFYFLEMNTRIQVEHPVTELVTGIDLIEEQLLIAQGENLRYQQADIHQNGHAIECRIYAEDPAKQFMPSPGDVVAYSEPKSKNIRIDSSLDAPAAVRPDYDPMISKLICFGNNRQEAIQTSLNSLKTYVIHGIQTNIPFLMAVVQNEAFISNRISTAFCDTHTESLIAWSKKQKENADQELVGAAFLLYSLHNQALEGIEPDRIWQQIGYWRLLMEIPVRVEQQGFMFAVDEISHSRLRLQSKDRVFDLKLLSWDGLQMRFSNADTIYTIAISPTAEGAWLLQYDGLIFSCERTDELNEQLDQGQHATADEEGGLFAPMPGKVIQLNVKESQTVNRGAVLLVVEAMKMENNIVAPFDAIVDKINVKTDEMVDAKTQLIHLSPLEKD